MSTLHVPAGAPVGVPRRTRTTRARLRAVPQTRPTLARGPFVGLVVALLTGGLLALLLLNTVLAQDAFVLHDLKARTAALADREQELREAAAAEAAPPVLAARARKLGMVPSTNPVFLRLADGRILGVGEPAPRPPKPQVFKPAKPAKPTKTAQTAQTTKTTETTETTETVKPTKPAKRAATAGKPKATTTPARATKPAATSARQPAGTPGARQAGPRAAATPANR